MIGMPVNQTNLSSQPNIRLPTIINTATIGDYVTTFSLINLVK